MSNPHTILASIPGQSQWFSVVDLANTFSSILVNPDSQFWFAFLFDGKPYKFTCLCQGYCESSTIYNQLRGGHRARLSKLQFVELEVKILGHYVSAVGKRLSVDWIAAIQALPKPKNQKTAAVLLGNALILQNVCARVRCVRNNPLEISSPEADAALVEMEKTLQTTPTLGIPTPEKPFIQTVDERNGCMLSVLLQKHGGRLRPVAYFSCKLDTVAAALPLCLRAVAAVEHTATATNITVKRCTALNLVSLLPTEDEGELHDCVALTNQLCSTREDLKEDPLDNPDLILYVDDPESRNPDTGKKIKRDTLW
ncbi:hypothetical protein MHYP_G00265900 [Metynnis hypsauchen]